MVDVEIQPSPLRIFGSSYTTFMVMISSQQFKSVTVVILSQDESRVVFLRARGRCCCFGTSSQGRKEDTTYCELDEVKW
jgi:hypothetical protein